MRALAQVGDLVGMTIAAECILSKEVGLAYAAVCVVDNLANGLDQNPLTIDEFHAAVDGKPVRAARRPRYGAARAGRTRLMALTVTNAILDGEPTNLRAVDGVIAALGPDVEPEPGDDTLDADGAALSQALVNGHTHAAMTLFRGWGDDLPLKEWLESASGRPKPSSPATTSTGARASRASR